MPEAKASARAPPSSSARQRSTRIARRVRRAGVDVTAGACRAPPGRRSRWCEWVASRRRSPGPCVSPAWMQRVASFVFPGCLRHGTMIPACARKHNRRRASRGGPAPGRRAAARRNERLAAARRRGVCWPTRSAAPATALFMQRTEPLSRADAADSFLAMIRSRQAGRPGGATHRAAGILVAGSRRHARRADAAARRPRLLVERALARLPGGPTARRACSTSAPAVVRSRWRIASERPALRGRRHGPEPGRPRGGAPQCGRLGLARVRFAAGDWFAAVGGERFDADRVEPALYRRPRVAAHRPPSSPSSRASALAAGADGLDAIRVIIAGAPDHLSPGGWLLLEHGADQGPAVRELLGRAGLAAHLTPPPDLAGLPRVTEGRSARHERPQRRFARFRPPRRAARRSAPRDRHASPRARRSSSGSAGSAARPPSISPAPASGGWSSTTSTAWMRPTCRGRSCSPPADVGTAEGGSGGRTARGLRRRRARPRAAGRGSTRPPLREIAAGRRRRARLHRQLSLALAHQPRLRRGAQAPGHRRRHPLRGPGGRVPPRSPGGPCYRCLYSEDDENLEDCTGQGILAPVAGVVGAADGGRGPEDPRRHRRRSRRPTMGPRRVVRHLARRVDSTPAGLPGLRRLLKGCKVSSHAADPVSPVSHAAGVSSALAGECRTSLRPLLLSTNPDPAALQNIRQLCQTEADAGDADSLYQLALFDLGLGGRWQPADAIPKITEAAGAGVPEAQYWLAWQYEAGPLLPTTRKSPSAGMSAPPMRTTGWPSAGWRRPTRPASSGCTATHCVPPSTRPASHSA